MEQLATQVSQPPEQLASTVQGIDLVAHQQQPNDEDVVQIDSSRGAFASNNQQPNVATTSSTTTTNATTGNTKQPLAVMNAFRESIGAAATVPLQTTTTNENPTTETPLKKKKKKKKNKNKSTSQIGGYDDDDTGHQSQSDIDASGIDQQQQHQPAQSDSGPTFSQAKNSKLKATVHSPPKSQFLNQQQQNQQQNQQFQYNPNAPKLSVLVRNMSMLEEDPNISYCAVRCWVVDRLTGESFVTTIFPDQPGMLVAMPAQTFPFDIRRRLSTQPEWNEMLDLHVTIPLNMNPNALLLFELLRLGNETIRGDLDYSLLPDAQELIAWGFLDLFSPTGEPNESVDHLVQLFRPPETRGWIWAAALGVMSVVSPTPQSKVLVPPTQPRPAVPQIFHTYCSSYNRNDYYPASLCVQFQHLTAAAQWHMPQLGASSPQLRLRTFGSLLPAERIVHRVVTKQTILSPTQSLTESATTSIFGGGVGDVFSSQESTSVPGDSARGDSARGGAPPPPPAFLGKAASDVLNLVRHQSTTLSGTSLGGRSGAGAGPADKKTEAKRAKKHYQFLTKNSFERNLGERCLPPNSMLHRFEIAGEITAIATSQRILAIAITSDFRSFICFYDVLLPDMPMIGHVPGHIDYVHGLKFDKSGKRLVSVSADKNARVWKTDQFGFFVKTETEEAAVCQYTMPHPFHVYDTEFLGQNALVTCGFDSRLYLWSLANGTLLATASNANDAFFRNVCSGGAVADSKLFALDSDFTLSTWRPMEDETTHHINNIVLRLRVRVPGAVSLVVRHSLVVLQCYENPQAVAAAQQQQQQQQQSNSENNNSARDGGTSSNNNNQQPQSDISICVVDPSLLTLIYKISVPASGSPFVGGDAFSYGSGGYSGNLRGMNNVNAFFPGRRLHQGMVGKTFILPDGRLIGYADKASRILFFDAATGDLFSSGNGVALTGASDVPMQCLEWNNHLHVVVATSDLAHTDQGRLSELIVCGRPRIEGEECIDESRSEAVRALFGGDVTRRLLPHHAKTATRNQQNRTNLNQFGELEEEGNRQRPSSSSSLTSSNVRNQRNLQQPGQAPSIQPSSSAASFGAVGSSTSFLSPSASAGSYRPSYSSSSYVLPQNEPKEQFSNDADIKMKQIVGFWKTVVDQRTASAPGSRTVSAAATPMKKSVADVAAAFSASGNETFGNPNNNAAAAAAADNI